MLLCIKSVSLLTKMTVHDVYVLSLDCEATGLSKYTDQIVELGLTIYRFKSTTRTFQELKPFRSYVRPTLLKMSKGATEITGITNDSLDNEAIISIVLDNMLTHINTVCEDTTLERCLVAYNGIGYDIPLLVSELSRYTKPLVYFRKMKLSYFVDVLFWSRQHLDKTYLLRRANGRCSYKLGDIYKVVCGKKLQGAHGALEDCRAVVDILKTSPFVSFLENVLYSCCCVCANETLPTCTYMVNPIMFVRNCVSKLQTTKGQQQQTSILELLKRMPKKKRKLENLNETNSIDSHINTKCSKNTSSI